MVSSISSTATITEALTVEIESTLAADIRLGHRKDIKRARTLGQMLLSELEAQSIDPVLLAQFGEMMRSPNEFGADRLNDLYSKIISTPGRVDTAKKLVETIRMTVVLEREAFGLDAKGSEDDKPVNAIASLLMTMKRSALPVVYEVERDENL